MMPMPHAGWLSAGFENPNGTIFSPGKGIIYQDAFAPMGVPWNAKMGGKHAADLSSLTTKGEHRGYPDSTAEDFKDGRPDLARLLAEKNAWSSFPEAERPRRKFKVWNGRLLQDEHMAVGGTLSSFFDLHGFALVQAPTAVTDFADAKQTMRGGVYPAEAEAIAQRVLSGRKIARIDHMSQKCVAQTPDPSPRTCTRHSLCRAKTLLRCDAAAWRLRRSFRRARRRRWRTKIPASIRRTGPTTSWRISRTCRTTPSGWTSTKSA